MERPHLKLLIQPGDGVTPIIKGIDAAKKTVEIAIFRFDRSEIESALKNAVARGVFVHALIAYKNRGGEKHLRELEMHLLATGVTVARTPDDLLRYHYKFMIIDRRILYLLAFNYTYLDIEHSRSFGVVTKSTRFVQEAVKLFEADTKRQVYTPGVDAFVVSPVNARKQVARFIQGAEKQLLIYDPKISDTAMIRLLQERAKAGVEVKIIGRLGKKAADLEARQLTPLRLHTRVIIRDRRHAFLGSQSLRDVELDKRRELGLLLRDSKAVGGLLKTFESDWEALTPTVSADIATMDVPAPKAVKKMAKAFVKELPIAPIVKSAVKQVVKDAAEVKLDPKEVEETVKMAVKDAVKDTVREVVKAAVE
jgi:cardiolipin synthase A/B